MKRERLEWRYYTGLIIGYLQVFEAALLAAITIHPRGHDLLRPLTLSTSSGLFSKIQQRHTPYLMAEVRRGI